MKSEFHFDKGYSIINSSVSDAGLFGGICEVTLIATQEYIESSHVEVGNFIDEALISLFNRIRFYQHSLINIVTDSNINYPVDLKNGITSVGLTFLFLSKTFSNNILEKIGVELFQFLVEIIEKDSLVDFTKEIKNEKEYNNYLSKDIDYFDIYRDVSFEVGELGVAYALIIAYELTGRKKFKESFIKISNKIIKLNSKISKKVDLNSDFIFLKEFIFNEIENEIKTNHILFNFDITSVCNKRLNIKSDIYELIIKNDFNRTVKLIEFVLSKKYKAKFYENIGNKSLGYLDAFGEQIKKLKLVLSEDIVEKILKIYLFEYEIYHFNLNIKNRFFLHMFELKNEKVKEKYFNSAELNISNYNVKISKFSLCQIVRWSCFKGRKNVIEVNTPLYYLSNKVGGTFICTVITSLNSFGINQHIIDELGEMILNFTNGSQLINIGLLYSKINEVSNIHKKNISYEDFKSQLDYLIQNNILIINN